MMVQALMRGELSFPIPLQALVSLRGHYQVWMVVPSRGRGSKPHSTLRYSFAIPFDINERPWLFSQTMQLSVQHSQCKGPAFVGLTVAVE